MDQNWWEKDQVKPPADAPASGIGYIPGPPKTPSAQTPAQATGDVLGNEYKGQMIGRVPLENAQTQTSIASGQNSIRNSNISTAQGVRDDFHKQEPVKNYITVLPQFASAIHAADNQAGDMQIVYAFGKVMDPGSSVREGEQQSAANVGGVSDRVAGYLAQLQGGGRLRPAQRQALVGEIRNRALEIAAGYNQTRQQYSALAQRSGLNPEDVVGPHPGAPFQQAEADFVHHPIRNLDGSQGAVPHGWAPPPALKGPLDPTGEGDIGFVNHREANALPPGAQEFQRSLQGAIAQGHVKTADDIIRFGKDNGGWGIPEKQANEAAAAIAKGVMPSVATPQFPVENISDARGGKDVPRERVDALVRGAASVPLAGFDGEAAAALDSIFGDRTMRENMRRQNLIDQYDERNHSGERLAGQVLGGFTLPTGAPAAGVDAAKLAVRAGEGRAAALVAGGRASAARLGKEGAGYGAAYGFGSTDGSFTDRLQGGALGGITGGATSYGIGRAAGALGVRMFARPAAERNALVSVTNDAIPPLVDPQTGRLNQPLESATPGQRVAAAGQYKIDLPLGAATDRGGAIFEKGLDVMPTSAGRMNDSRRAVVGQVENALEGVAGKYGQGSTLEDAGAAAQQGAKAWIGRFDRVSGKAYDAIPISADAQASTANATGVLQQLTSRFQSNDKLREMMRNNKLEGYLDALTSGKLSWQDLKTFRSVIGKQIGEQRFSDDPAKDDLRALYAGLSDDMRATASSQGAGALRAFERANTVYAQGQQRIEGALVRILGDDSKNNPEAAAKAIQAIAKSNGGANIAQLAQIRASLAKGGEWGDVASSLIHLLGQPSNSSGREFKPETFVQNYADMSERARNLLFGDKGRADLRRALDGFVAVNQRLAGTNALRNTSNTTPGMIGAGVASGLASQIGAAVQHPVAAGATLFATAMAGVANYGIARAWTNPDFVRWATGYTKMMASNGSPSAVKAQIGRLAQIESRDPELSEPLRALATHLLSSQSGNNNAKQDQRGNKKP